MTKEELDKILADHAVWLCSVTFPREGKRASLVGANLRNACLRGASLDGANLRNACLVGASLRNANLVRASLDGASLDGANLDGANLRNASLRNASLDGASLDGAKIDLDDVPLVERLDSQILAQIETQPETFDMGSWHVFPDGSGIVHGADAREGRTCGTTHCRAGWAVHLAGKAGYELEAKVGPQTAGILVYLKSTGRVPDFFADNSDAIDDLRECAAKEAP